MPSESMALPSAGMSKGTCLECKHTVLRTTVEGKTLTLDTELLTVVSHNPRDRSARKQLPAHQLHTTDRCLRIKREAEKEQLRKDKAKWDADQAAKLARATKPKPAANSNRNADADRLLAELNKQAEQLRDGFVSTMAALRKLAQRVEVVAKRGRRGKGL